METYVIATRASVLALWQAEHVQTELMGRSGLEVSLLKLTTTGDRILSKKLSAIGGKGLFVKELEAALLDGRADAAVHSLKDVPMELPDGFTLAAVTRRELPNDVFVSSRYASFEDMPEGAVVGTSSLRREMLIRHHYPKLNVKSVRGNVGTRLAKLDAGDYDALVMAYAGLSRLGLSDRIRKMLPLDQFLPSPGQGALGIECLCVNERALREAFKLEDNTARICTAAEREVSRLLGGSCQVPLGAYAQIEGGLLRLTALIGKASSGEFVQTRMAGDPSDPLKLARLAVGDLMNQGARRYMPA